MIVGPSRSSTLAPKKIPPFARRDNATLIGTDSVDHKNGFQVKEVFVQALEKKQDSHRAKAEELGNNMPIIFTVYDGNVVPSGDGLDESSDLVVTWTMLLQLTLNFQLESAWQMRAICDWYMYLVLAR